MVSIIIYTHNSEKTLKRCIDSILGQTYENFEIIIVDDCSKDKTISIALDYEDIDNRVQFLGKLDKEGPSHLNNTGMYNASGNYIMFLNHEDTLKKTALEVMVHNMKKYNADLVMGNIEYAAEDVLLNPSSKLIEMMTRIVYTDSAKQSHISNCMYLPYIKGNKLWNADMIFKNRVKYKNVQFGEDVVFYHMGLAFCKTVVTIPDYVLSHSVYGEFREYNALTSRNNLFEIIKENYQKNNKTQFLDNLLLAELYFYINTIKKLSIYCPKKNRKKIFKILAYHTGFPLDSSLDEETYNVLKKYNRIKKLKFIYLSDLLSAIFRF